MSDEGTERRWERRWFFLVGDRLCYTRTESQVGRSAEVEYLPLDRIPVRPRGRKGKPGIGVRIVDHRQIVDPKYYWKWKNCVVGLVCGNKVHYMVADHPTIAQAWVDKIVAAWKDCALEDTRTMDPSDGRAGDALEDTALKAENAMLKETLSNTQDELLQRESAVWQNFLAAQQEVIELREQLESRTTYRVEVRTSVLKGAGTDGKVTVELVGPLKSSGPRLLESKKGLVPFQRGQLDVFDISGLDLGDAVQQVKVSHQAVAASTSWTLHSVRVKNLTTKKVAEFPADDAKLESFRADGLKALVLHPGKINKGNKYKVDIYTGDFKGASTDADVYLELKGAKRGSGVKWLAGNQDSFARGGKDSFTLQMPNLGALMQLTLGHNGRGHSPDWNVQLVHVYDQQEKQSYVFPFSTWIKSSGFANNSKAQCSVSPVQKPDSPLMCTYKLAVQTSDLTDAGTDSNVEVELIGQYGSSGRIQLHETGNTFSRNARDEFQFEIHNLGEIQCLVVKHDNSGRRQPGWHLDRVLVQDLATGKQYPFLCQRWLAWDRGDGKTQVVLQTNAAAPKRVAFKRYVLHVTTSMRKDAGTSARVFVKMYGSKGASAIHELQGGPDVFQPRNTDKFRIDCPDVGMLSKIKVAHDGTGKSPAWALHSVVIEEKGSGQKVKFHCGDTLKDRRGKMCSVELGQNGILSRAMADTTNVTGPPLPARPASPPKLARPAPSPTASPPMAAKVDYEVSIKTSDVKGAATDARAYVRITGAAGTTGVVWLDSKKRDFERGASDSFTLHEMPALGELRELELGHDKSGRGFLSGHKADWHVEHVKVYNMATGEATHFPCGDWLGERGNQSGAKVLTPASPPGTSTSPKKAPASPRAAEPPASPREAVQRSPAEALLEASKTFAAKVPERGPSPEKAGRSPSPRASPRTAKEEPAAERASPRKPAGGAPSPKGEPAPPPRPRGTPAREGSPAAPSPAAAGPPSPVEEAEAEVAAATSAAPAPDSPAASPTEDRLSLSPDTPRAEASPRATTPTVTYVVEISTSDVKGAATTAKVFVKLSGTRGATAPVWLEARKEQFARGRTDTFTLEGLPDVGELEVVEVGHDASGGGLFKGSANWHVGDVRVTNAASGAAVTCYLNDWIGDKKGPEGYCSRTLPASAHGLGSPRPGPSLASTASSAASTPAAGGRPEAASPRSGPAPVRPPSILQRTFSRSPKEPKDGGSAPGSAGGTLVLDSGRLGDD